MTARLIGIARAAASRAPLEILERVTIGVADGLDGDFHGTRPLRQVSVLFQGGAPPTVPPADIAKTHNTRPAQA